MGIQYCSGDLTDVGGARTTCNKQLYFELGNNGLPLGCLRNHSALGAFSRCVEFAESLIDRARPAAAIR